MPFDKIRALAVTSVILTTAGCGGSGGDAIERDVFVATYIDLRTTALDTDSARLSDADRDAVLARHGVTDQDLLNFADVHADELEFMREVWNEIELQLDRESDSN
ncbi:MAG: hypothetical protein AAF389_12685 [Gemmatimonadota bacterium]